MNWSQLGFVGRRARHSLWEFRWSHLLTSLVMAMTLFVFGAFMLVQENLEALLQGWGDRLQINAYVDSNFSREEVPALHERLRKYPEIARVRHISQEQAWIDFQVALGSQSSVLEGLPREVLPASFEITLRPHYRDGAQVQALAARLKNEKGISSVEYAEDWVDRISLVVLTIQWAKWILGGVLFLTTYVIVGSTVKLAILARKEEIEIMQLVGASEAMIQAPFVLEGLIQGVAGGAFSLCGLWLAVQIIRDEISSSSALFGLANAPRFLSVHSAVLLVAMGWILGAAGSLFALRRFLRTWKG